MIKYSYKDKELKVPTGVGNNNNEGFEEGYDLGYEEGVDVSFDVGYQSGATDGLIEGIAEQKAKLSSIEITNNGDYTREDGWSSVTVNISVNDYYESGYTSGVTDGFNIGYESGSTDAYESGYESGWQSGYTSGYTVGYNKGYRARPSFSPLDFYFTGDVNDEITIDSISAITLFGFKLYPATWYGSAVTISRFHNVGNIIGGDEYSASTTVLRLEGNFDLTYYPYSPKYATIALNKQINAQSGSEYDGVVVGRSHPIEPYNGLPMITKRTNVYSGQNGTIIDIRIL